MSHDWRRRRRRGKTPHPVEAAVNLALERGSTTDSVHAAVSGSATAISGGKKEIRFREIVEEGTVSYLGEFALNAPDTYTFTISITPENGTTPYTLKFTQDFVRD